MNENLRPARDFREVVRTQALSETLKILDASETLQEWARSVVGVLDELKLPIPAVLQALGDLSLANDRDLRKRAEQEALEAAHAKEDAQLEAAERAAQPPEPPPDRVAPADAPPKPDVPPKPPAAEKPEEMPEEMPEELREMPAAKTGGQLSVRIETARLQKRIVDAIAKRGTGVPAEIAKDTGIRQDRVADHLRALKRGGVLRQSGERRPAGVTTGRYSVEYAVATGSSAPATNGHAPAPEDEVRSASADVNETLRLCRKARWKVEPAGEKHVAVTPPGGQRQLILLNANKQEALTDRAKLRRVAGLPV